MSERRAARTEPVDAAEIQAQVDAAADELYALPPDDFSAARDDLVKQAREQRNQPLARELAKLRKPTQSAWLINLLWRDQREVMEQLFELAAELEQAQASAAGAALRELTQQRRQIENALLRRAVELASQAGVRVSDSVTREAQETLGAALAVPEVADEVRSGRLVKPATYAGFGGAAPGPARPAAPARAPIDLQEVQRRRAAAAPTARGSQTDAAQASRERQSAEVTEAERQAAEADAEAARQAEEERRAEKERQAAEERKHQLEAAQQALGAAQAELRSATRAAEAAGQRRTDLRTRLDTLREQLQRLETDVERAEHAASEAEAARAQAEAAHAEAEKALAEAQR